MSSPRNLFQKIWVDHLVDRQNDGTCLIYTNRNFKGRQGKGGRTHLLSPQMGAAAAVFAKVTDVRKLSA